MKYSSHNEVQQAVYSKLAPSGVVDAILATTGCQGVYDIRAVPENAVYDYITLGLGQETHNDTFDSNGFLYNFQLDIWSRQRSSIPASTMLDRLDQMFHRQPLALATLGHCYTHRLRCSWLADPDGLTLHVATFYSVYSVQ